MVYVYLNKQNQNQEILEYRLIQLTDEIITTNKKLDTELHNIKKYFVVFLIILTVSGVIFLYIFNQNQTFIEGGYFVTQPLIGDSIKTGFTWHLYDKERVFHIHIKNHAQVSEQSLDMIKDSIMSEKIIEVNDMQLHKGPATNSSKFYIGWNGAINEISSRELKHQLPTRFHVHESMSGEGDVTIMLVNERNLEGYSGYTRSMVDQEKEQILKSYITIYEANKLDESKMANIVRHEMGHALGLYHSTDPDDIMYQKIQTDNPYISECDLGALESLYDGKKMSEFICEK